MTFTVEDGDLQRVYNLVYTRCIANETRPSALKNIPTFARKLSASIVAKAEAGSPYMIEQVMAAREKSA